MGTGVTRRRRVPAFSRQPPSVRRRSPFASLAAAFLVSGLLGWSRTTDAQSPAGLPELTQPVNDFGNVIDAANATAIDQMSRALKAASGDIVVVVTIPTIEPYSEIREYANRLFENQ